MRNFTAIAGNRMRTAFLVLLALVICPSAILHAQAILGTWQGTLPITENPRIILKISKDDNGSLRGVFHWIDRFSEGIPLSSVSFVSPDLSVAAYVVDTSYRGKLSADGKSIVGTWTQNEQSYPLTLIAAAPDAVWKHDSVIALSPMSATADPAFEVATIKPSMPNATQEQMHATTRHFIHKNATVADMIEFAYKVKLRQIEGGPSWTDQPRFDITAEPDTEGQPSVDQFRMMMKKLLAHRFQLKIHSVQKIFPVYALTVEKSPPKINISDLSGRAYAGIITKEGAEGQTTAQFVHHTMPEFANLLMGFIPDRQIIDETGLNGPFDFTLTAPTNELQSHDDNDRANALIQALQPLGFKLVPKKVSLEVIVIDHLEKPSEN